MGVKRTASSKRAVRSQPKGFSGSIATTGNSRGLRLEAALFKAAPEFGVPGSHIRADLIGPGAMLITTNVVQEDKSLDPIIQAWLSFLDKDTQSKAGGPVALKESELSMLKELVTNVQVDDDYELPADITF